MRIAAALLVLLTALPLAGAGLPLAPPTYGMSPYSVSLGGTATNGKTFLTVWHLWAHGHGTTIFGVLTNADGTPISEHAFEIVTLPNRSPGVFLYLCQPVASADGYVLFWSTTAKAEMAKLTDDGRIRERRVLDFPGGIQGRVTASGDRYFLEVHRTGGGTGYLLDRDGSILAGDILLPWSNLDHTITAMPDGFAVTVRDASGIWTERIARDGTFGRRVAVAPRNESGWIATASHGATLGITWASTPNLWLATVDAAGNVQRNIVRSGFGTADDPPDSLRRVVAGWVVITRDELVLVGDDARVRSTATTGFSLEMNVAATDTHIHGTTEELVMVNGLWSKRVVSKTWQAPTLTRVATGAVSRTLTAHVKPVAVQTLGGHLVAWNSRALSSHAIEIGVLLPGAKSIQTVYEHGRTTRADGISSFALGTNGVQSLLVWNDNRTLYGQILDPNGTAVGPRFVVGTNTLEPPAIEWTGTGWLVAWLNEPLMTAHVTPSGIVTPARAVRPNLPPQSNWINLWDLDLEWNGTQVLAVVTRNRGTPRQEGKAYVFRLDAAGALDGSAVLELPGTVRRASLATNNRDWIVIGEERGAATATVVDSELRAGATTKFFEWINEWLEPFTANVDWNGNEYVVAIRYSSDDAHWLSMHRLSRTGVATAVPVVASVGAPDMLEAPSVAGNIAVFSAFNTGEAARATMLTPDELAFVKPPAAPQDARIVSVGQDRVEVAWADRSDNERGFVIERHDGTDWIEAGGAGPNATRGSAFAQREDRLRVRAWNEGGVSAATEDATPVGRRRSSR